MNKLYYLASPYSSKDPMVVEDRYLQQQRIAAELIKQGYMLITPIEMCHNLAQNYDLPRGYEYWKERDRLLVSKCDGVIVCIMDGWKESIGVTDEIAYARSLGREVLYYLNGELKTLKVEIHHED
jgi:hypothetical protein